MSKPFDQIASLHTAFMSSGILSEPIVLTRSDGRQYPFSAVIQRFEPEPIAGATNVKENFAPRFEFWVPAKLPTTPPMPPVDLSSCPPNKNSDRFCFPTREGDRPSDHAMSCIVKQDATGWLVRCR